MKPYEKENLLVKKIKQKREHQHRRKVEIKAIEKSIERLDRTYKAEKEAYLDELKARHLSIDKVEQQIQAMAKELQEVLPKSKPKNIVVDPKNGKVKCKYCPKEFSKSGIKSHQKACLKKIELAKLQEEIDKLELEDALEELNKEEQAEIIEDVEEIIEDLEDSIDLDNLDTEGVSFIDIETKEEGEEL